MISTYWLNKALDDILASDSLYVGLSSSGATSSGTGYKEPNGGNYARVKINGFSASSNCVARNKAEIVFPVSMERWFSADNMATHWLIFDGNTSQSNLLACGELEVPREIPAGIITTIPKGAIAVTLADISDMS